MTLREEIIKNSEGLNEWTKSKLANSYGVNAIVKHPGSSIKNTYEHERDKDPVGMSVLNPYRKSTNKDELVRKQNAAMAADDRKKEFNRSPYVGFYLKHREEGADKFDAYSRQKFQLGKEIFDIVNKFTSSTRKGNSELKEDTLEEMPMVQRQYYDDEFQTNIGLFVVFNDEEYDVDGSFEDLLNYIKKGKISWRVHKNYLADDDVSKPSVIATIGGDYSGFDESGDRAKAILTTMIKNLSKEEYAKGLKELTNYMKAEYAKKYSRAYEFKKAIEFVTKARKS